MPARRKRSISLPPDLDAEIQVEARRKGVTYSRWLADAARRELKVRAGLEAVAEVEEQLGSFTSEELVEADEWARDAIERARRSGSSSRRAA
jgi:hypothetical protein